jgi:hypothetical protein
VSPASTTTERPWTAEPVLTLPPLPRLSLAPQVEAWCTAYLRQPDGPDAGGPLRFTREQRRFLWCWYAIDERGRWVWSRGVLRRPKGWGKSPVAGALSVAELCGPVRFGGWDPAGAPLAVPVSSPWVQVAGASEKQTDNTLGMVRAMLEESPAVPTYGLDVGLTRVYSLAGGKLEPITAAAATAEGARPTFVVMDEPHHWLTANGGHKLAEVIRRNLAKVRDGSARALETTNAHEQGRDSVAEKTYEAWQAQVTERATGRATILYDSREAPPGTDLTDEAQLMAALAATYGDSTWVDLERIRDEVYDPQTPVSQSRRFYLNQLAAAEDAWVRPELWDRLADPALRRANGAPALEDGELVALGFDGSKSDDHSALIATRISDGAWFTLGVWDPAQYGGEAPRELIDEAVLAARDRYDVVAFFADLHPFESYVDKWAVDFGPRRAGTKSQSSLCVKSTTQHAIAFDLRTRQKEFTTVGIERLLDEIVEGVFRHDGNPVVRQHVHNARARPNAWGITVGKEHRESARKIDALPAGVLSRMARRAYLALPRAQQRRQRSGRAAF